VQFRKEQSCSFSFVSSQHFNRSICECSFSSREEISFSFSSWDEISLFDISSDSYGRDEQEQQFNKNMNEISSQEEKENEISSQEEKEHSQIERLKCCEETKEKEQLCSFLNCTFAMVTSNGVRNREHNLMSYEIVDVDVDNYSFRTEITFSSLYRLRTKFDVANGEHVYAYIGSIDMMLSIVANKSFSSIRSDLETVIRVTFSEEPEKLEKLIALLDGYPKHLVSDEVKKTYREIGSSIFVSSLTSHKTSQKPVTKPVINQSKTSEHLLTPILLFIAFVPNCALFEFVAMGSQNHYSDFT
jgi:uncharacterized protein (DUF1697 family)